MGRITDTVKHIIIINVILWIATIVLINTQVVDLNNILSFHYPGSPLYKLWQFITHMFMHASIDRTGRIIFYHILFNMVGIWMFGSPLERMWGRSKFLFFYFSAGLGAVLLQLAYNYYQYQSGMDMFNNAGYTVTQVKELLNIVDLRAVPDLSPMLVSVGEEMQGSYYGAMLGASGALYGIIVAFAFSFPNAELMMIFLPIPIKAKFFVPLMILGDLFFGFSDYSTGIAHFAHVGGALFGFLMMWYWKKNQFNGNRWN